MTDQPTPKPLAAEEEAVFRKAIADTKPLPGSKILDLLATLDAARAESAALRAAVAEAEKQRDMEKGWKDAQTRGNQRLSQEVHALQEANQRLMVKLADKFAESGEGVEVLIASRDALAAELADAKAALRAVRIELAALVADPENPDWRLFHPEIREPDAKCLTDAYDAARAAASKPANETAWLIERGQPEGQSPTLWWTGSNWMDRAADAWRYGTKGEAEAELTKRSGVKGLQYHGVFGRVVEHIFIGKEPANDAARELDAGGGGGA